MLKTNGYNLEHNFGHGSETLASVLVVLNLLAFAFYTVAMLAVLAWRQAMAARGARYRFFEHLRTITAMLCSTVGNTCSYQSPTLLSDRPEPITARPPDQQAQLLFDQGILSRMLIWNCWAIEEPLP